MSESMPPSSIPREKFSTRLKQSVGRAAVRLAAVVAGAGTIMGVGAANDIGTSPAEASPYSANGAEKAWCRWPSRFSLCNEASSLAGVALTAAAEVAKETHWSIEDGGADAVRHCYWNALMTQEFGRSTASGFAWRHEYDESFGSAASNMDLHNNSMGRDWANTPDPLQRCIDGVVSGELVRIKN
jgi:hypothetical protein